LDHQVDGEEIPVCDTDLYR